MTTAQIASRSGADSSTVCSWITNGLRFGKKTLRLRAKKIPAKHGGLRWDITDGAWSEFKANRKALWKALSK